MYQIKNLNSNRVMKHNILILFLQLFVWLPFNAQNLSTIPASTGCEERLQWWRDAKFGLFVHWGPASVNGTEISWSRIGHPHDHHGFESVPAETYDHLYKSFNPLKFDADQWMKMAKEAGFKYVVFITKHHDGFCMWPSKMTDYSIANTPFKRDICKEIADAAHKYGIKLGWYYSTRDWTQPDYLVGDNKKYNDYYESQVEELLTNYGKIDIIWFDHVAGNWNDYTFNRLFEKMYSLQSDKLLVNNRAAKFIRETEDTPTPELQKLVNGDFDTPEQQIGKYQYGRAWESCLTINKCEDTGGWSYRTGCTTRSYEECLKMLVSCATGDGNLLLNIGPMPTGEIEADQIEVLKKMGKWLKKYGNTIYGTRGGPFINGAWGGFTYKDDKVYLHILDTSMLKFNLPALKEKIVSAKVITGGEVKYKQSDKEIEISVSGLKPNQVDVIVELLLNNPVSEVYIKN